MREEVTKIGDWKTRNEGSFDLEFGGTAEEEAREKEWKREARRG